MPLPGRPTRPTVHRTIVVLFLIALALFAYGFANIGRYLTKEDPIEKGDAIAVLAGTRMDRALEAADLYKRGFARLIVLTQATREGSLTELARRGIIMQTDAEITGDVLRKLGIPATAIVIPRELHNNTAQEARTIHRLAVANNWRRLIVVTSRYHLRRAGFAIRRELSGTGIQVAMHGTRYEHANPDWWWTSRGDWRWVLEEGGKLVAYEFGLGP